MYRQLKIGVQLLALTLMLGLTVNFYQKSVRAQNAVVDGVPNQTVAMNGVQTTKNLSGTIITPTCYEGSVSTNTSGVAAASWPTFSTQITEFIATPISTSSAVNSTININTSGLTLSGVSIQLSVPQAIAILGGFPTTAMSSSTSVYVKACGV